MGWEDYNTYTIITWMKIGALKLLVSLKTINMMETCSLLMGMVLNTIKLILMEKFMVCGLFITSRMILDHTSLILMTIKRDLELHIKKMVWYSTKAFGIRVRCLDMESTGLIKIVGLKVSGRTTEWSKELTLIKEKYLRENSMSTKIFKMK